MFLPYGGDATDGRANVLLEDRNAVIYGGGGTIGGAVARAFAREGATVHLAGRTLPALERVADGIRRAGGKAETAQLDAFDEEAVGEHAERVVAGGGSLDVSLNAISHPNHLGTPVLEMEYAEFEEPVTRRLRTMWVTSRAAARHMTAQGSGVILAFGGYGDPVPNYGGFQASFGAIEALRRTLSIELGPKGVRVVTLQTGGIPEGIPDEKTRGAIEKSIAKRTMLGRAATLEDVGNAAVFAASDWGRALTATKLNITCGTVPD
jgi:NAD(P)-dependent dehydrogenase (short-subunit alcohol dehydrogenase family)